MRIGIAVIAKVGWNITELTLWLVSCRPQYKELMPVLGQMDIVCARNEACERAMRTKVDLLIMVNDDVWPTVTPAQVAEFVEKGKYGAVSAHKAGPGGETHRDGRTMDTAFLAITRDTLKKIYRRRTGWFPQPVLNANGTGWAACECITFSRMLEALDIPFKVMDTWVTHRHEGAWGKPPTPPAQQPTPPAKG